MVPAHVVCEATKQATGQQQQTPLRVESKSSMYGGLLSPKHGGLVDQVLSADRCSCTGVTVLGCVTVLGYVLLHLAMWLGCDQ